MSTSYYHFRPPVTSVNVEHGLAHDRITVFENRANTGTLTVSKGLGKIFVGFFTDEVDYLAAPMRTHFGGKGRGCVVTIQELHLHPDTYLADAYGNVFTVAQITAMDGRGA